MSQQIAKLLHASDESPREIFRAMLPGLLVIGSCAFVLTCLHALHTFGIM